MHTANVVATAGGAQSAARGPAGADDSRPRRGWQHRTPITGIEAQRFRAAYDHRRERECAGREITPWQERSHWLRASIDRVALIRALIERGYLLIRSRRVTAPITPRSAGRMSSGANRFRDTS